MLEFDSQLGVKLNAKWLSMLLLFALLILSTTAFSLIGVRTAHAQSQPSSVDVKVSRLTTVYDGGLVTINDTVTLSRKSGEQPPLLTDFQIGFPYKYKFNIYHISAYDSQTQQRLAMDLDTGLGVEGFYGVKIHFLLALDLNTVESYRFILVSEFADLITARPSQNSTVLFDLDFPVYPSLAQEASASNTTVILPPNANYTSSSPTFNQTSSKTLSIVKEPLDAFAFEKGKITFEPNGSFNLLDINEVKREIILDDLNNLLVSDHYIPINRASNETSTVLAILPLDAFGISAKDDLGSELTLSQQRLKKAIKATISLKAPIKQNQTADVFVAFSLPWKDHVSETAWSSFAFNFRLFEPINLTMNKLTVTVDLPGGAQYQSSSAALQPDSVEMGIYNAAPIFTLTNVSSYQTLNFIIHYGHMIFWSSFRSTLWTGALVAVIGVVALAWQVQRAPAPIPTTMPIRPEELRTYVKTYEEQRKLLREQESLETQARKGKIPRRLYRVRSRTLDSRISVLSRDLAISREKIRAAGPRYAEMMRQIEVAQSELQAVEADIKRTEVRYRRGEISAAAYHKLLEDYYRRRDRAQTNIDGILLRLREEIS
jgi:hypothetical protein